MRTYQVEITETITKTYVKTLEARSEQEARDLAVDSLEDSDIPDDWSTGYDVWTLQEIE